MQALKSTRYVDTSCRAMAALKESPHDVYLIHLVRLQQKADKVGDVLYNDDLDPLSGMMPSNSFSISMLEKEVADIDPMKRASISQASLLDMSHKIL
ncbi:uncharacterized protein BDR25DRAFT_98703 [Lindgomyces ingoldianus]|uniref:Uncharacterized protein n=1 Tax=Lindgomyces ingoldianus TaxID=673940 RepID=A0ACB6QBC5_9PLEO|nr:uncharacterized protein BDR25DRAFT_98703 [Lindgomyces ingoldianus]KAF2464160.1 hypothetical protein BDR25DRAFT_98703 [Lindgomyces ingoldianus]